MNAECIVGIRLVNETDKHLQNRSCLEIINNFPRETRFWLQLALLKNKTAAAFALRSVFGLAVNKSSF